MLIFITVPKLMSAKLIAFPNGDNASLRVFCPDKERIITSFEDYLPESHDVGKIPDCQPHIPPVLCWLKENYEYYAYLPKDHLFDGHLLAPLKHHTPSHLFRDGRWYADQETRRLWQSLDSGITKSINVIGCGMLTDLYHREPSKALSFGFTNGHKTERYLSLSLSMSKNAIIHRLAYLTYLISHRYKWDQDLADQEWWLTLRAKGGNTWADSIWDVVYKQCKTRDFIGVVVQRLPTSHTGVTPSLRWLRSALRFGVPIWVSYPGPGYYQGLDGDFVMKAWEPTEQQVTQSRALPWTSTKVHSLLHDTLQELDDPHPVPDPAIPSTSTSIFPPPNLPKNTTWYESWKQFFDKRAEGDKARTAAASEVELQSWEDRAKHAKSNHVSGKAKVYDWESCDTGGFLRVLKTKHEVNREWDTYHEEALVFNPIRNTWDHCSFMFNPPTGIGAPDDFGGDDDNWQITEPWYMETTQCSNILGDNCSPSDFLHRRYGFLSTQPASSTTFPPLSQEAAYRTVGLDKEDLTAFPEHLVTFIRTVMDGRIPEGHCDLSPASPHDKMFPQSCKVQIFASVFSSRIPELCSRNVFTFVDPSFSFLLVIQESLCVLDVARAGLPSQLCAQLEYLLLNGCRFTFLYPRTVPLLPPNWNILTFPVRESTWVPTVQDFKAYMSRLRVFFLERPYMLAAAFSRGGIAWRLAAEVIGLEDADTKMVATLPQGGSSSVQTPRGQHWFHQPEEGEWFYLVGGYEILTGL